MDDQCRMRLEDRRDVRERERSAPKHMAKFGIDHAFVAGGGMVRFFRRRVMLLQICDMADGVRQRSLLAEAEQENQDKGE